MHYRARIATFLTTLVSTAALGAPLCDNLSECQTLTAECSAAQKEECCQCQETWGVTLAACSFDEAVRATPTPTPLPTPTPSPTATSTPDGTPTVLPTVTPTPHATVSPTPTSLPTVPPGAGACADGVDNDGDGLTDYVADLGCSSPSDDTETGRYRPLCDNAKDDDSDTTVDVRDQGCLDPADRGEVTERAKNGCVVVPEELILDEVTASVERVVRLIDELGAPRHTCRPQEPRQYRLRAATQELTRRARAFRNYTFRMPKRPLVCQEAPRCHEHDQAGELTTLERLLADFIDSAERSYELLVGIEYPPAIATQKTAQFAALLSRLEDEEVRRILKLPSRYFKCQDGMGNSDWQCGGSH